MEILSDLTPGALSEAVTDNLLTFFDLLGSVPGIDTTPIAGVRAHMSDVPFPLFNGTVQPRIRAADTDAAIAAFIAEARSRRVPMLWWLMPGSEPNDLGARLEGHGFVSQGAAPGMAADLTLLPDEALPPGVTIRRVDAQLLPVFIAVLLGGFGFPEWVEEPLRDFMRHLGLGEDDPAQSYIAFVDAEPTAVSSVFYGAGVAGIYNVATLPAFRGQGIGRAVTLQPLLDARRSGYRAAILHSSPMGVNLYRRLGFETYCEFSQYVWTGDGV